MLSVFVSPATRRTLGCAALLTLFGWWLPVSLRAQCNGLCGDVDSSGAVTISGDWVKLMKYVFTGLFTGTDLGCADVDGHGGVNAHDLQYMAPIFSFGGSLDCTPDTPVVPVPNQSYFLHHNSVVPPGVTSMLLHLDITVAHRIRTLSVPLRILVDSQDVSFGAIDSTVADGYGWESFAIGDHTTANVPPSHIMAGYTTVFVSSGVDPGRYPIGTVEVLVPPSADYRILEVELVNYPRGDNAPMVIQRPAGTSQIMTAWQINVAPYVVGVTGDTNNDRALTATDIIGLVNFVFKSGPTPYPVPATGDVNCSGSVTSSDVIELVNHMFKSGPPPCDVVAECTINLDQWTCP